MKKELENDEDANVEDTVQTPQISRSEVVRTALRQFEQGASLMDLLSLHPLRDELAKCRVQYGITHFLKNSQVFFAMSAT
ncbi:hypothetical protein TNCV_3457041 [Trichonephila clavipes]|nr:hypothetical protein TNCV_3457041 [Trichonephila clavipes]